MSRLSFIPFLFLCLTSLKGISQNEITITGKVLNNDFEPVSNCKITETHSATTVKTDKTGAFTFPVKFLSEAQLHIEINHFGFSPLSKNFTVVPNEISPEIMVLELVLEPLEIGEVTVFSGPQTIFKSDKLNVSDFEFTGNAILLLTYEKRPGHHQRLLLTDYNGKILSAKSVPDNVNELQRDYNDNIHVKGPDYLSFLVINNDLIYLLNEDPIQFENYIKPLVAKSSSQLYISNYSWHYPAFSYYAFNVNDSTVKTLRYIEDKFLLDLYRAEYKYVDTRTKLEAARMEYKTGVDKEIWAAVWNGFPNSLYYKPVYAPMFARNDTVMIFDHYVNKAYYFNSSNDIIDSVNISYHASKEHPGWKKKIIQDDVTGQIYSLYENNGWYTLATLGKNGQLVRSTKLEYKYPEKIRVHDGNVFFNYRPFESTQNKYLYKQQLN